MAIQRMTEFRVGLFVFMGGLVAMVFIFFIGSEDATFGRTYSLHTSYGSVSGLRTGASVVLAGIRVGTVEGMSFADDLEEKRITISMQIERKHQDRIRADSVATIETQGLLGDKFIQITVGSPDQPVLKDGELLTAKETASLFDVASKASSTIAEIEKVSRSLSTMFEGEGKGDITATVKSLRHTIEEIEKGEGVMHELIYDPKGKEIVSDLAETAKTTRDVVARVDAGEGTLGRLVRDPALYDDIRTLFGRASRNKLLKAVIRATMQENEKQVLK